MTPTRASIVALACAGLLAGLGALAPASASAQMFGRFAQRAGLDDGTEADVRADHAPAGTRVVRDVAYGADAAQRFDVYVPEHPGAAPAPVVFFVHGGGWQRGDKAMSRVVEPKVAHWAAMGWIVISSDYRMLPTPVATQAEDVAAAVAYAQAHAAQWGADPARFVLMGHSAGAHLVALIAAGNKTAPGSAQPRWRGAVLLDSAVLDVPMLMSLRHLGLYDRAFGADASQWPAVSPYAALVQGTPPFLEVCSSRRRESCIQADRFATKVQSLGGQARVLREDLSHGEINMTLGAPSDYTSQVDAFLQSVR